MDFVDHGLVNFDPADFKHRPSCKGASQGTCAFPCGSCCLYAAGPSATGADSQWGHCGRAVQHHLRHSAEQKIEVVCHVPSH